jgi:hypothetical protein
MIDFFRRILRLRRRANELPISRVYSDSQIQNISAGTLYRLLRPRRWAST